MEPRTRYIIVGTGYDTVTNREPRWFSTVPTWKNNVRGFRTLLAWRALR